MGFTDNSDIFASFEEEGINRLIRHLMTQRPALFNYATAQFAGNQERLCAVIKAHPIIAKRSNPQLTIEEPLPIFGTNYGINFAAQLTEVEIDFHPGNKFQLPPQLSPPLGAQSFALRLKMCAGIGCPPDEILGQYIPPPPNPDQKNPDEKNPNRDERPKDERDKPLIPLIPLPSRGLTCFCLEAFAVGKISVKNYWGKPYLELNLLNLEIVDIKPEGLENSLECYAKLLLKLSILPKLRFLLEHAVFDLKKHLDNLKKSVFVNIKPTPTSGAVPNNPALEDDQVKIFADLEVI